MPKETKHNAQRGFTVVELTIVMVVSSLLLVPLLKLVFTSMGGNSDQQTEAAMEEAVVALISYADINNGCLPFAADFEGGLPDTDAAGVFLTDTGVGKASTYAGDLPWADLGLAINFRDGDFLRIQYYVASPYADTGTGCSAGFRGQEWNPQVTYVGTVPAPIYVYDTADQETTNLASLYKIKGTLTAGNHPANAPASVIDDVTVLLPGDLLEVRRGPDVNGVTGLQEGVMSAPNVFVLIAPGENLNVILNRRYVRDSTHISDYLGAVWPIVIVSNAAAVIDNAMFSLTHNVGAADPLDDGDDSLRVMSFIEYKSRLTALGMVLQPICETVC